MNHGDKEGSQSHGGHGGTEGVKTLLGDPKKAMIKLSVPMIIAMSVTTLYNLADALWVAGLGKNALAAVGFFFPIFFTIMALATGIGIGGGAAISRRIGAKDKKGADSVAVHTLVLMLLVAIIFSLPMFLFSEQIFVWMGADNALEMSVSYAKVIFAGAIFLFFSHVANAILRAEGDAKRAMYIMVLGSVLNIILDPIFIYTFDMGVAGAAWATVLSMAISSIFLAYWLFFKSDTYVTFTLKRFRFRKPILKDIFTVGIPASIQQLAMSLTMLVVNVIAVKAGGEDGVAIFSTGWRVAMLAILPLLGIATAIISISGAAFGAKEYQKLGFVYRYGVKIGATTEIFIAVLLFLLAPQIAGVFTKGEGSYVLTEGLTMFIRLMSLFYPGVAFGMFASSLFQGAGKGMNALVVTLLRTVLLTPPLSYMFAFVFGWGLNGVWLGLVVANIIGSIVASIWAIVYIKDLIRKQAQRKKRYKASQEETNNVS